MKYLWWRCQTCGALRHDEELNKGECSGHRLIHATTGTLLEFARIKMHGIKNRIKEVLSG